MSILENESFRISSDYFKAYYQIQALSRIAASIRVSVSDCLLVSDTFRHLETYASFPVVSAAEFLAGKQAMMRQIIVDEHCEVECQGAYRVSLQKLADIDCLDITGFFSVDNQDALRTLVRQKIQGISHPKILEIGSWKGLSSSILAFELARANKGRLYCLDGWSAIPPNSPTAVGLGAELRRKDVFSIFRQNLQTLGLWERVNVLYGCSQDFADIVANSEFDIIFIDGQHAYSGVLHDLRTYLPKLRPEGLIIGDDCEASITMLSSDFIDAHADEDYALLPNGMDIHCGVSKALQETFNGEYELHRGASVWSKDFAPRTVAAAPDCPLCGAESSFAPLPYGDRTLRQCCECRHATLDEASDETPTTASALPSQDETWIEQRLSMIGRYITPSPGDRLLEVGCAAGELLHHFSNLGCRVAGCDPHPDAENRRLGIISVALDAFPDQAKQFDYLFAFHVLEQVDDPPVFLSRCLALLKARGEMLLLVSLLNSFSHRHTQYFSDISIRKALNLLHVRSVNVDYEIFRDARRRIYRNAIVHVVKQ